MKVLAILPLWKKIKLLEKCDFPDNVIWMIKFF